MGYSDIVIANSYKKAMVSIQKKAPNLILLDLQLKDGYTGVDIAYHQSVIDKIPIICITGHKDSQTIKELRTTIKVKYYLSKPIKEEELEFYLPLVLELTYKRGKLKLGDKFSYDLESRELFGETTTPINLTKKERTLLEQLIEAEGELLTSKELQFKIWGYDAKETSSLRTLIGSLRKRLLPEMIINIPYLGYKLIF
jgi:DNA-binding response OmpR family regulator